MTYDTLQSRCYASAEKKAQEQLTNWQDTVIRLTNQGWTAKQIDRLKKQIELNAKGIFRS